MKNHKSKKMLASLAGLLALNIGASGAWVKIQDFESGMDNIYWSTEEAGVNAVREIVEDPLDSSNNVFYLDPLAYGTTWNATHIWMPIPEEGIVPFGETGTLYVRFYHDGHDHDHSFSVSDLEVIPATDDERENYVSQPETWEAMGPHVNMHGPIRDTQNVEIRDGNNWFLSDFFVPTGEWIEYWIVFNTSDHTYQLYGKTSSDSEPVQINALDEDGNPYGTFEWRFFREDSDVVTASISTTAGNPDNPHAGDVALFDDYYVASGMDLSNPTAEVSTWGGFTVEADGVSVNTENFMGWVDIRKQPWIWIWNMEKYAFIPEPSESSSGSWVYLRK